MNWRSGLEDILEHDAPLSERTTFHIGGTAEFLLTPRDTASFARAYKAACASGLPVRVLGCGSNLLVDDAGVPGIILSTAGLRTRGPVDANGIMRVAAGANLKQLVSWCAQSGLNGLECLAGIPGTVGGAVVMNAGAYNGSIGAAVRTVWCVARDGKLFRRDCADVEWAYRRTDIDAPVVEVEFKLGRENSDSVLDRMADALITKHRAQPVGIPSAGCFFKNPPGDSAGRLIDAAGLKGISVGHASVSAQHANFIVNHGGASSSDVLRLFRTVKDNVRERFGVALENEVRFWPSAGGMT